MSITKTIVDNINNVLGAMPKPLNFELSVPEASRPKRRTGTRSRARTAQAKRRGRALVKKAKRVGQQAKRKLLGKKKATRRGTTVVALRRKSPSSQRRAA